MKNGHYPKCSSQDVYSTVNGGGVGDGFSLHVLLGEGMHPTRNWQTFLCASCGYFENYLLDEARIAQIVADPQKAGWKKIS